MGKTNMANTAIRISKDMVARVNNEGMRRNISGNTLIAKILDENMAQYEDEDLTEEVADPEVVDG